MNSETSSKVVAVLLDQIDSLKSPKIPDLFDGAEYYSMPGIPNPQIVDYYAAEVGVLDDLWKIMKKIDVMANENRTPEILKLNPDGGLPFLKLSNGKVIAETIAICKLIEDAGISTVKLFGNSATEQAEIFMWQRRVDGRICMPAMDHFRWGPAREMFKERGQHADGQPEAADGRKRAVISQLQWLEGLMDKSSEFICCNKITIVDIQLFCILNFFMTFDAVGPPCFKGCFDGLPWLTAWHARMISRPAQKASLPSE